MVSLLHMSNDPDWEIKVAAQTFQTVLANDHGSFFPVIFIIKAVEK